MVGQGKVVDFGVGGHGLAPHMASGQVLIPNPLGVFAKQIFPMLSLF